jgi:hypothetical protein
VNLKGLLGTISRSGLASIAIAFGLLTLAGYFFVTPTLTGLRILLLNLAVILTGFAVFVGVANLLNVHFKKVRQKDKGSAYSLILVIFLLLTFLLGLAARFSPVINSLFSGTFNYIQLPVEASLMALLVVTLTLAAIRLLRRRLNLLSILFPGLSSLVRPVIDEVFATAGARGILLGVALGTLVMGLRILFGIDRPYGGK